MNCLTLTGLAVAVALLASPAPAPAATVGVQGGTLVYQAGPGEQNHLTFEPAFFDTGAVAIQDSAALTAGPGCSAVSATKVDCALAGLGAASFSLGDGADSLAISAPAIPVTVSGGAGNDTLGSPGAPPSVISGDAGDDTIIGGDGADRLAGGDGNDTIQGQPGADSIDGGAGNDVIIGDRPISGGVPGGNDVIRGGPGNDTITGQGGDDVIDGGAGNDVFDEDFAGNDSGAGADTIRGAAGRDRISYHFRDGALRVSLDGRADDGQRGERDNVKADVEGVMGAGGQANVLIGSAAANMLRGGRKADRLSGGGGPDTLFGFGGSDVLSGGSGADKIYASDCQRDRLIGGPGRDFAVIDIGRTDRLRSIERGRRARCA